MTAVASPPRLTPVEQQLVERYATLRARYRRLNAAEDRAFAAFMSGTGPRSSVRSAASRVNRISPDVASASDDVYSVIDRLVESARLPAVYHYDVDRFVDEILQEGS